MLNIKYALTMILPITSASCASANFEIRDSLGYALVITGDDVLTTRFSNQLLKGITGFKFVGMDKITERDLVIVVDRNLLPVGRTKYVSYVVLVQSNDRSKTFAELTGQCEVGQIEKCAKPVLTQASQYGLR